MELLKVTQENIDKMVRKGLNAETRDFQPDEFTDYSSICSEDLIIATIRVLSSLSEMCNYNYEVLEVKTII